MVSTSPEQGAQRDANDESDADPSQSDHTQVISSNAVDSTQSEIGQSGERSAQRRTESRTPVLPTYEQIKDHDLITTAAALSQDVDLEAGLSVSMTSATTMARIHQPLPPYSPGENVIAPSDVEVIRLALEDAAAWKSGEGSAYFIPQLGFDETVNGEVQSGIILSSSAQLGNSSAGSAVSGSAAISDGLTDEQNRLLNAYFKMIKLGDDDMVRRILESGLVSANVRNPRFTVDGVRCPFPLIVAIKAKRRSTALLLVEYGAVVDGWYVMETKKLKTLLGREYSHHVLRTPLQVAAQDGNLPLVKALRETCHAADDLISPTDGQTALRLAAGARHQHVVDYLPATRGGAGLRWRAKWRMGAAKIYKDVARVGEVLRGLFWSLPRAIVRELVVPGLKWVWKSLKNLPELLPRLVRDTLDSIRELPSLLRDAANLLWRVTVASVKAIPGFCTGLAKLCWHGLCRLGKATAHIFSRLLSLLHSAMLAMGTFFRNLTWTNLWHSLVDLLHAILVQLPCTIWSWPQLAWTSLVRYLDKVFHFLGSLMECLILVAWYALSFFPRKAFNILVAAGDVTGHAFQEILIWWNPKHVTGSPGR